MISAANAPNAAKVKAWHIQQASVSEKPQLLFENKKRWFYDVRPPSSGH